MDGNFTFYMFDNSSTESEFNSAKINLSRTGSVPQWYESGKVQIPLYAVIFMLAVVGNTLVILTLVSISLYR